ncbi:PD40 domain-containing protein [Scytonema hofmannii FACHB-248]|uniref:PD40 domain-containing protein n=1 Tax=Scytonema hofmannii FACHB-248 TaxID=1842502 RepID=A0ABR8GKC3_9CYAN|nr:MULTISPECIES: caspase family protein [Nostocales]MBD2603840.1 PD40 domain-containing protein [Scytonema hofmannii FACHB-248]
MSRDALVVGINFYEPSSKLCKLTTPAQDAEAIAKLLEDYGEFNVTRLPAMGFKKDKTIRVHSSNPVNFVDLEKAITQLFKPESTQLPETALLYFSGHGWVKPNGLREGFLATTDFNEEHGKYGLSLRWLQQLLQESEIPQQIIILDCCYSGALLNFDAEANPGNKGKVRDRCFIAACRDFEIAYQEIGKAHSVLTKILLEGLEPPQQGWVTNYRLIDLLSQKRNSFPQTPVYYNSGEVINLTKITVVATEKPGTKSEQAICPYKGLKDFECNDEDVKHFYGRTKLIDELIYKLDTGNFLAVLGASGSGKSSVVKAGLLYQLKLGRKLSGSETWQFKDFRPGDHPLQSLALTFVNSEVSDAEKSSQLIHAQNSIAQGAAGLKALITVIQKPVLLMVDQFEEVFTLCKNNEERKNFFDCLLGALELSSNNYYLVITMRADFFDKCTEYSNLAQKIQNHQVIVSSMNKEELKDAIKKPAEKVGLEIEPELVTQMIADVAESPGMLPLLQHTLWTLWNQRKSDRLTVQAYINLGGIRGALEKTANQVYDDLSSEDEKQIAQKIFLELTQLGEGTEDTRRQVRKQDLLDSHSNPKLVEQVLQKLVSEKVRLLVTSAIVQKGDSSKQVEKGSRSKPVEVVDVAHEALIRHWDKLRQWLNESRNNIRIERKIEAEAKEWIARNRAEDYLLTGGKLIEAEIFLESLKKHPVRVFFDKNAQEFVEKSIQRKQEIEERERQIERAEQERERKREQEELQKQKQRLLRNRVVLGVTVPLLFGALAWIWNSKQNTGIIKLAENSNRLSDSNKQVDALVESIKAANALKNPLAIITSNTRTRVVATLGRAIYDLKEINSLKGHGKRIDNVSFSPDGKTVVSGDQDGAIKLWSLDGTLLQTIQGHTRFVRGISFSPDGKMFASASSDGTVKLWNLADGKLIQTFLGHGNEVYRAIFSSDGKTLVSASTDGSIKFWSLDGSLIKTIKIGFRILDMSFSPNGKILAASGSKDGTFTLLNVKNNKSTSIDTKQCNEKRCLIFAISFSPDGKFLATGGDNATIKLWKSDGTYIGIVDNIEKDKDEHTDKIRGLSFSPKIQSGEYLLASASTDKSVRVWFLRSNYDSEPPKSKELKPKNLELSGHDRGVLAVNFTDDGQTVASASEDGTVKLWNIDSRLKYLPHDKEKVKSVSFSPDGKTIASASHSPKGNQGNISLWNWNENSKKWDKKLSIDAHRGWIWQVSFSPNGQTLASASNDGTINLWSREGKLLTSKNIGNESYSISFSPDGKTLASGDANKKVILWEYKGDSLTEIQTLSDHTNGVRSVSFSPDGQLLASADFNNIIKLWRKEGNSWEFQKNLVGHQNRLQAVTFSPDGQLLVSSSTDGTVRLWNRDGKLINTLYGHTQGVTNVAFSPDSQIIASAGADISVILWGRDGSLLRSIKKHTDGVYDVEFSPDGQTLASASDDGRVILWNLNFDQLLEGGCALARNYLRTNSSITSEVRNLCKIPAVDAKLLIEQGRDLARKGNTEGAIAKFKEAQQQGQTLDFKPEEHAKNLFEASQQLAQGLTAAKQGKLEEAAAAFEKVIAQEDPAFANSGIKPEQEAQRLYALNLADTAQLLIEGVKAAKLVIQEGKSKEAADIKALKARKKNEAFDAINTAIKQDPAYNSPEELNQEQKTLKDNDIKVIAQNQNKYIDKALQYYQQAKGLYPQIEISSSSFDFLCPSGNTRGQYAKECSQIKPR